MAGPGGHRASHESVLAFWFGALDELGRADEEHSRRWFQKHKSVDETIRRQFSAVHGEVTGGAREDWLASPRGRLAYVIVLDQFTRNMFRGTGLMFMHDGQALMAAEDGLAEGVERKLQLDERPFLYLPLVHAEDLEAQQRCVLLLTLWRDELQGEARDRVNASLEYAERHRDVIQRFGRFPHRNALIRRESTPAELQYLEQAGAAVL